MPSSRRTGLGLSSRACAQAPRSCGWPKLDERNALQLTFFRRAVVAERRRGRRTASRSRSTCEPMTGERTSMSSLHEAANPFESRPTRPMIMRPAGRVTGCGSTSGPRAAAGTRSGKVPPGGGEPVQVTQRGGLVRQGVSGRARPLLRQHGGRSPRRSAACLSPAVRK